jgi:alkylation response protein AidB-like acyl-CoA dehydrogenase
MVTFNLTEEQVSFQKLARDFAKKEIAPIARLYDTKQNPRDCFVKEAFGSAIEHGFQSLYIPQEYGGLGKGDFEAALVFEEIGAADAGFASTLAISASIAQAIVHFGTEEQKERWLPRISKEKDSSLGSG